MSSVNQLWLSNIPWKMQSILMNGLRAPDQKTASVKKLVRWMRTQCCNNADPQKPDCYMTAPEDVPSSLIESAIDELEYLTCHYVHHFADAMRVIAIYHPKAFTKKAATIVHELIAEEIFHFKPETDEEFIYRHRDKVDHA